MQIILNIVKISQIAYYHLNIKYGIQIYLDEQKKTIMGNELKTVLKHLKNNLPKFPILQSWFDNLAYHRLPKIMYKFLNSSFSLKYFLFLYHLIFFVRSSISIALALKGFRKHTIEQKLYLPYLWIEYLSYIFLLSYWRIGFWFLLHLCICTRYNVPVLSTTLLHIILYSKILRRTVEVGSPRRSFHFTSISCSVGHHLHPKLPQAFRQCRLESLRSFSKCCSHLIVPIPIIQIIKESYKVIMTQIKISIIFVIRT